MKTKILTVLMIVLTTINVYAGEAENLEIEIGFWIASSLFMISFLFLIIYIKKNKRLIQSKGSRRYNNVYDSSVYELKIQNLTDENQRLKKNLNEKERKIKELDNLLISHEKNIISAQEFSDENVEEKTQQEITSVIEKQEKFYYATNINSDGYFDVKDLIEYTNGNEYYKISINKELIEFEFLNNKKSLSTSLEFIDEYIKPFCFEKNYNNNPTKIITLKKGKLIKEGNRWKVQSKAEIKYE